MMKIRSEFLPSYHWNLILLSSFFHLNQGIHLVNVAAGDQPDPVGVQGGVAVQGHQLPLPLSARPHPPHLPAPVHVPRHTNSSNIHAGQHHLHHRYHHHHWNLGGENPPPLGQGH